MTDEQMEQERTNALEAILLDTAPLKLVIAGPGTGKSYTFKRLLDRTHGPTLALTFLTALVSDLRGTLGQDVAYSFHGFARKLLHSIDVPGVTRSVDYYPAIELLYEVDLLVTDSESSQHDIGDAFMNLREELPIVANVLRSGHYYDAVGHTDSVYRVLKGLEADPNETPTYAQIVVDEYQDFSLLEVGLIDRLTQTSPILVVGDDDQALYTFRHASASYIRKLADDNRYKRFELPFCTRCTAVLIDATRLVTVEAQKAGLLKERLGKPYVCYLPDKRADSKLYPKIKHIRCSVDSSKTPYIARYIAHRIRHLEPSEVKESHEKGYPTVLIIGKKQYTNRIYEYLTDAGFPNLSTKPGSQLEVCAMDGYTRLRRNRRSRLGWRILLHCHEPAGWDSWVNEALLSDSELVELLDPTYHTAQLKILDLLDHVAQEEVLNDEEVCALEGATGSPIASIRIGLGVTEPEEESDQVEGQTADVPEAASVQFTTMVSSKGLEAAHVFLVGMNERSMPLRNQAPTDEEVCQLIVALTRGRKSCTLLSCDRYAGKQQQRSIFVKWLAPTLAEERVDKACLESLGA